jgi:hypothetical protein
MEIDQLGAALRQRKDRIVFTRGDDLSIADGERLDSRVFRIDSCDLAVVENGVRSIRALVDFA